MEVGCLKSKFPLLYKPLFWGFFYVFNAGLEMFENTKPQCPQLVFVHFVVNVPINIRKQFSAFLHIR